MIMMIKIKMLTTVMMTVITMMLMIIYLELFPRTHFLLFLQCKPLLVGGEWGGNEIADLKIRVSEDFKTLEIISTDFCGCENIEKHFHRIENICRDLNKTLRQGYFVLISPHCLVKPLFKIPYCTCTQETLSLSSLFSPKKF